MANEIRIKHLEIDEQAVEANFDQANFPVDLDNPDKTLRVTGSFWRRIFHPLKGNKKLDFTAKTLTAHGNTGSAEFIAGLLGAGWNIDKDGNAEMRSLKLWERLIVPELIKNQIGISRDETWFTDGGVIDKVVDNTVKFKWATSGGTWAIGGVPIHSSIVASDSYAIKLKDKPSFRTGDLVKAIVENKNGFDTAKMRVDYLLGEWVAVRLRAEVLPAIDMVIARVGNDTDKDRQSSIYVDALSGWGRVLADMDSFTVQLSNIKFQAGNLSGLRGLGYNEEIPPVGVYAPGLYIGTDQVAGLGAMIKVLNEQIELKVSAKDFEAAIEVTNKAISQKVSKDSLISEINQSAEQIKILAEKIKLEGYTTINAHFKVLPNGDVRMVNAYVSGEVIAERGRITGVLYMGNESGDTKQVSNVSSESILYRGNGTFAAIGKNVLPSVSGVAAPSRFESNQPDPYGSIPNIAIYASASGSAFGNTNGQGNHALYAQKGDIYGYSGYTKQITISQVLEHGPKNYYCYNTQEITLTLPPNTSSELGKEYWIKKINDAGVRIGGNMYSHEERSLINIDGRGQTFIFINDGKYWQLSIMNS